jgi:hypothetical protein
MRHYLLSKDALTVQELLEKYRHVDGMVNITDTDTKEGISILWHPFIDGPLGNMAGRIIGIYTGTYAGAGIQRMIETGSGNLRDELNSALNLAE